MNGFLGPFSAHGVPGDPYGMDMIWALVPRAAEKLVTVKDGLLRSRLANDAIDLRLPGWLGAVA